MYVTLNKDFILDAKKMTKAEEDAKKIFGEDAKKELLFENVQEEDLIVEIEDLNVKMSVSTPMGYFAIDIPLSIEDLSTLLETLAKKVNKIKTILEASK